MLKKHLCILNVTAMAILFNIVGLTLSASQIYGTPVLLFYPVTYVLYQQGTTIVV